MAHPIVNTLGLGCPEVSGQGHPLGGFRDRYGHFWRAVLDSPALRARAREVAEELEAHLAELIAGTADDRDPRLTAALIVAAYRTVYTAGIARILAGEPAADVTIDHITAVNHAFDTLETGLESRVPEE